MKNRSHIVVFLLISLFVLVSLACGMLSRTDPTATIQPQEQIEDPVEVVEEPVVVEVETETPTSTELPTREIPPTETAAPTEEITEEPFEDAEDAPPVFFTEEFDGDIDSWSYFLMNGDESKMDLYTDNSRLVFDLQGQYLWVYVTYDEYIYSDVRIDVNAENLGRNTNNVSLICNYSDRFGWYEFNISNGGLYWIYVYSEIDGDYFTLASGGSKNVRMGRDENTYTAICQGNRLALYINGVLEREHIDTKYNLREGLVGFSVSSFDVLPILVEIDYFSISVP
jgi:hypothetical protein